MHLTQLQLRHPPPELRTEAGTVALAALAAAQSSAGTLSARGDGVGSVHSVLSGEGYATPSHRCHGSVGSPRTRQRPVHHR